MARISTDGGVFTLEYGALRPSGEQGRFQSCYRPGCEVVFERREDTRPDEEYFLELFEHRRRKPRSEVCEGIYPAARFPHLLTFIDKLEFEESIFLNWRLAPSSQYSRIAIGTPHFYTYGPEPMPAVSELLFHEGGLAFAWVRPTGKNHELVFTRLRVTDISSRRDEVLEPKLRYVTQISAANIGADVLVAGHRGVRDESDARVLLHFTRIDAIG